MRRGTERHPTGCDDERSSTDIGTVHHVEPIQGPRRPDSQVDEVRDEIGDPSKRQRGAENKPQHRTDYQDSAQGIVLGIFSGVCHHEDNPRDKSDDLRNRDVVERDVNELGGSLLVLQEIFFESLAALRAIVESYSSGERLRPPKSWPLV